MKMSKALIFTKEELEILAKAEKILDETRRSIDGERIDEFYNHQPITDIIEVCDGFDYWD